MFVVQKQKEINYLRCINFAVIIVNVNAFQNINVRRKKNARMSKKISCRKNLKRFRSFTNKLNKFIVVGHYKRLR